jgi:tetratricopeptide (TPR) repeat protein
MAYDLFVSYARKDNARNAPNQPAWVTAFIDALKREHRRITTQDLEIFFDEREIVVGEDWEVRIRSALRESRLLLAFLSSNYFASPWCHREFKEYRWHELDRHLGGEGVQPIRLFEGAPFDRTAIGEEIAKWIDELSLPQYLDFSPWLHGTLEALQCEEVRQRVESLDLRLDGLLARIQRAQMSPGNVDRHYFAFVGRLEEMRRLRLLLTAEGAVGVIVIIYGLGSIGKTSLATEYANSYSVDYNGGRWKVNCEGLTNLATALLTLATPLKVEFSDAERKDPNLALQRILVELEARTLTGQSGKLSNPACLLLLDNIDQPELLASAQVARLPKVPWLHVLATTRLARDLLATELQIRTRERQFLALDELPEEAALQLMECHQPGGRFATEAEQEAARQIVRHLGNFTLAVEAAAVYLGGNRDTGITCKDFLYRLTAEGVTVLDSIASEVDLLHREDRRENQLSFAFGRVFESLSPEEQFVLACAALLPSELIPLPWLRTLAEERFPHLAKKEPGYPAPWDQLTRRLLGRRLLLETADLDEHAKPRTVRMHRLLQGLCLKQTNDNLKDLESFLITYAIARAMFVKKNWIHQENRWEIAPLAACAEHWSPSNPKQVLELVMHVSVPLIGVGLFLKAESLYRYAVRIAGEDQIAGAIVMACLGGVLPTTSKLAEAESLLRESLHILEEAFGPEHDVLRIVLPNLGCTLIQAGRFAEAEPLLQRAIHIGIQTSSKQHPDMAFPLEALGTLYLRTNRYLEAESLFKEALLLVEKDETVRGGLFSYPMALAGLGAVYGETNRLLEAEPLLQRANSVLEKAFSTGHPFRCLIQGLLAAVLMKTNRTSDAEVLLRQAIEGIEKELGSDSNMLADFLTRLGELFQTTGRFSEGEPVLRRALTINETTFGNNHPQVAKSLQNLATLLAAERSWAEANSLLRQAVAIQESNYGPDHPEVARPLILLSVVLAKSRQPSEASNVLARARQILAKYHLVTGQVHPYQQLMSQVDTTLVKGALVAVILVVASIVLIAIALWWFMR